MSSPGGAARATWWHRWRWRALWSLPVISLAWLGLLYTYYGRVCGYLGRPPESINEHAGLEGGFHHGLVFIVFAVAIYYVPVWSLGVIIALFKGRRPGWVMAALASAWIVPAFVWALDPGGVFEWILD